MVDVVLKVCNVVKLTYITFFSYDSVKSNTSFGLIQVVTLERNRGVSHFFFLKMVKNSFPISEGISFFFPENVAKNFILLMY